MQSQDRLGAYLKKSWLIYIESKVKNYIIYKLNTIDWIISDNHSRQINATRNMNTSRKHQAVKDICNYP